MQKKLENMNGDHFVHHGLGTECKKDSCEVFTRKMQNLIPRF